MKNAPYAPPMTRDEIQQDLNRMHHPIETNDGEKLFWLGLGALATTVAFLIFTLLPP